eukprot:TRINITY_DN3957_c0_g1_i2.p1 TRINITY_DN3957_c0_g1~~TRINITY_DN3957_c0_g1_i2.p1  ORF type:complete len:2252 (-),score=324.98 TRINITY_DN3957_c0_g1_i2:265-7020(-)
MAVWSLNMAKLSWELHSQYGNTPPLVHTAMSIIGNKMLVFGGYVAPGLRETNRMRIINLDSKTLTMDKLHTDDNANMKFPLQFPSRRMSAFSFVWKGLYYIYGGSSTVRLNDVWIFDPVQEKWIGSTISKYPVGRLYSNLFPISGTEFIMYGGLIMLQSAQFINDVWKYDTATREWVSLSRESDCSPTNYTCMPAVENPSVGYYENCLYVFGGRHPLDQTVPILRRFNITAMKWDSIEIDETLMDTIGLRYNATFATIGSQLIMWSGYYSNGTLLDDSVVSFDMRTLYVSIFHPEGPAPGLRSNGRSFVQNSSMCFQGGLVHGEGQPSTEIWCLIEGNGKWQKGTILNVPPLSFSDSSITYLGQVLKVGGKDQPYVWMYTGDRWVFPFSFSATPFSSQYASTTIVGGKIVVTGGRDSDMNSPSNAVYTLDTGSLFCNQSIIMKDRRGRIDDGSGDLNYFPGTNCSWTFEKATSLYIYKIDVASTDSLILEVIDSCDILIMPDSTEQKKAQLSNAYSGSLIRIPSGRFKLSLTANLESKSGDGFRIEYFDCGKGHDVKETKCICDGGRFITFQGDCVRCPNGTSPSIGKKDFCQPHSLLEVDTGTQFQWPYDISPTEQFKLSRSPPPLLFSAAVEVSRQIYVIGGRTTLNGSLYSDYLPMDTIYILKDYIRFDWIVDAATGDIPSPRARHCLVSISEEIFLIGGESLNPDPYVYKYNVRSKMWKKAARFEQTSGLVCAPNNNKIYAYGGEKASGLMSQQLWEYNPVSDSWSLVGESSEYPKIKNGAGIFYQDTLWIVSGSGDTSGHNKIFEFNIGEKGFNQHELSLDACVTCDEEKKPCTFDRESFSLALYGSEIHIFGGKSKSKILHDVMVFSLESKKIVYRKNYMWEITRLPIQFPPPKFGAAFASIDSKLIVVGGGYSLNGFGSDAWTWDPELRIWIGSSSVWEPIHRKGASLVKTSDKSFSIFGGSTTFSDEVLLNDIWSFDLAKRSWENTYHANEEPNAPPARFDAIMGYADRKIYIMGGTTYPMFTDDLMWIFDTETRKWSSVRFMNVLGPTRRPFNRDGISYMQVENQVWAWGGKLSNNLRGLESYTSIFKVSLEDKSISITIPPSEDPPFRTSACMSPLSNTSIIIYGGEDFNSQKMNDFWVLQKGSNDAYIWKREEYRLDGREAILMSKSMCVSVRTNTILFGGLGSNRFFDTVWMLQHDSKTMIALSIENKIPGVGPIAQHAGGAYGSSVVSFGGFSGYSISNIVHMYRPGLCYKKYPKVIESKDQIDMLDDGSGTGYYMADTDCEWILPNATHLISNSSIGSEDIYSIYALNKGNQSNHVLIADVTGGKNHILTAKSESGFRLTLKADPKKIDLFQCQECIGFKVKHARCPTNGYLDAELGCQCQPGNFINKNYVCAPCSSPDDDPSCPPLSSDSDDHIVAISVGTTLGTIFMCVLGWFYVHTRRRVLNLKKKLFAQIEYSELEFGRLLGSGGFGEVYAGTWRGTEVAIKKLIGRNFNKGVLDSFMSEISVMVELRHPNIVLYMGASVNPPKLCIVCELLAGSLHDLLHEESIEITLEQQLRFCYEVAKGMQYLHSSLPPVLHRDLKSPNLLLDDRWALKISDFGLSGSSLSNTADSPPGTMLWMAPEVMITYECSTKSDVYSFAIIIWEIFFREEPYKDMLAEAIACQVCMGILRPPILDEDLIPKSMSSLMKMCWSQDPKARPGFTEIVKKMSEIMPQTMHSKNSLLSDKSLRAQERRTAPPRGNVALVSTQVQGSTILWEHFPDIFGDALMQQNEIIRGLMKKNGGYEVSSSGDSFLIAFRNTDAAILFSLQVQEVLLSAPWPNELLSQAECALVHIKGSMIFKGLRVGVSIHYGSVTPQEDPLTGRVTYIGPMAHELNSMAHICQGGQILLSQSVHELIHDNLAIFGNPICRLKADLQLPNAIKPVNLYEITPASLIERHAYFDRQGEDDTKISGLIIGNVDETIAPKEKAEWYVDFKDVKMSETELGSGSYGKVYLGEYNGENVAIKKLAKQTMSEKSYFAFLSEVVIMRQISHANILRFYGACAKKPNLSIILEYAKYGSLKDILSNSKVSISSSQKMAILYQVADAMNFLHKRIPKIIHRDLKSSNVLVTDLNPIKAKIGDFGMARVKAHTLVMTKCGTMSWMAPEVLEGKPYNEKVDVFSFGMLIWEVFTRKDLQATLQRMDAGLHILKGVRPEVPSDVSATLKDLIPRCWSADPGERPQFDEIMKLLHHEIN